ncbi:MAG: mycofactocin precursor MftA [Ktedonobacteraceae bacterium]
MENAPLSAHEFPLPEQSAKTDEIVAESAQTAPVDAVDMVEEIEEELIIEDFTIDGICGVY